VRLIIGKVLSFFRSTLLALILLITILISCVVGTAVLPDEVGRVAVFSSLWFNSLLVLLVLNVAFCFFSRVRLKGWNLVSTGMIIFHLSFVSMFAGIIIDSLFYYRGILRLTEGETMALKDPNAYDEEYWGRFFKHEWIHGVITFHKLHTEYREANLNKGVANEISVVGDRHVKGVIYPTRHLDFNDFRFYRNKDGFAPLFVLYDRNGRELYGAFVALQSFEVKKGVFLYSTGTKQGGPGSAEFPQIPGMPPLFKIQFIYHLPKLKSGDNSASFKVWDYDKARENGEGRLLYEGTAPMGERVSFGDYSLSMNEARYWASIDVLYNPGQPIVMASLWLGLSGMVMTFIGRLRRRRNYSTITDQLSG
jgi:cytochrome c biogenesis protein ResB